MMWYSVYEVSKALFLFISLLEFICFHVICFNRTKHSDKICNFVLNRRQKNEKLVL